jgi:hypothetical protein
MILRLLPFEDDGLVNVALHPAYPFAELVDLLNGGVEFETPVELVAADGAELYVDFADYRAVSVEDTCL